MTRPVLAHPQGCACLSSKTGTALSPPICPQAVTSLPWAASGNQEPHGVGSPAGSASLSWASLFQLLASSDINSEEFAGLYKVQRYLRRPSLVLFSLVLRGLITLSQRPETVSRA